MPLRTEANGTHDHLERDGFLQQRMLGAMHWPHRALTDTSLHFVHAEASAATASHAV
jgi:hypothetical protein